MNQNWEYLHLMETSAEFREFSREIPNVSADETVQAWKWGFHNKDKAIRIVRKPYGWEPQHLVWFWWRAFNSGGTEGTVSFDTFDEAVNYFRRK